MSNGVSKWVSLQLPKQNEVFSFATTDKYMTAYEDNIPDIVSKCIWCSELSKVAICNTCNILSPRLKDPWIAALNYKLNPAPNGWSTIYDYPYSPLTFKSFRSINK